MSQSDKNELLFQYGINYNDLPSWQKRGVGIFNREVNKQGYNPVTQQTVDCVRNELFIEKKLPIREDYRVFLREIFKNFKANELQNHTQRRKITAIHRLAS
jgi:tRNA(His) 5'-end guanylyltransferase